MKMETAGSSDTLLIGYSEVYRGFPQFFAGKLGHHRFLPNPFLFTIYQSIHHSTLYTLATESVVK
jgi:hypothetical protein